MTTQELARPTSEQDIHFPHGEVATDAFAREYPDANKEQAVIKQLVQEFVTEEIQNINIFTTERGDASFPYTMVKVKDLAKKVMASRQILPAEKTATGVVAASTESSSLKQESPRKETVVIFPSFPDISAGTPFTFVEIALQQTMRALGPCITALAAGREPDDTTIITLGSPANKRWGSVSPEYVQKTRTNAFATISHSYAEFLQKSGVLVGQTNRDMVMFHGLSMGGSFAEKTAKELLDLGEVTQDYQTRTDEKKPLLQVLMESPSALNPSRFRDIQIKVGFIAEAVWATLTDSGRMKLIMQESAFLDQVDTALQKKGVVVTQSADQPKMKKEIVAQVIKELGQGIPTHTDVKVTTERGFFDLTLRSSFNRPIRQRMESLRAIGQNVPIGAHLGHQENDLHRREMANQREFGVASGHLFPFYRRHEMKRWKQTADAILRLDEEKASHQ